MKLQNRQIENFFFHRIENDDSKLKKHDALLNEIFGEILIDESKKRAAREDRAAGSIGGAGAARETRSAPETRSGEDSSRPLSKWLSKKAVIKFVNDFKK